MKAIAAKSCILASLTVPNVLRPPKFSIEISKDSTKRRISNFIPSKSTKSGSLRELEASGFIGSSKDADMSPLQRDAIRKYGTSFVRDAVKSVGQSVVRIDCDREVFPNYQSFPLLPPSDPSFREADVVKVSGSGIIMSRDGFLVTNAHVIQDARRITITLSNGRSFKVRAVACDELSDLAVLKADVDETIDLIPAPLGDSASLQSGDWVIAVGCPAGLDFTVTLGIVSNPQRSNVDVGAPFLRGNFIQTDAALNSGNSGGPLVNDHGEVVGINTMVRTNTEAIGFAIPINRVKELYGRLKQGHKPSHPYFGMEMMTLTPDYAKIHNDDPNAIRLPAMHGAMVVQVLPNSPAASSGMRKYDVITEVNGQRVNNIIEASAQLGMCRPGSGTKIAVCRGEDSTATGTKIELQVTPSDLLSMIEERKKKHGLFIKPSLANG